MRTVASVTIDEGGVALVDLGEGTYALYSAAGGERFAAALDLTAGTGVDTAFAALPELPQAWLMHFPADSE
jgi:hypothetical protein